MYNECFLLPVVLLSMCFQVAAGLTRAVTVELFAMAVGAIGEHGAGHIYHQLEITTQPTILYLPVRANILTYIATSLML